MRDLNEANLTDAVLQKLTNTSSPRVKKIMSSLIENLHKFIREVEPTQEEWTEAIHFLTEVGQKCNSQRQEFILMSDTLGASMLVDVINNRKVDSATESSVLGPYYLPSAPEIKNGDSINVGTEGEELLISGRVLGQHKKPISDAILDIWQTGSNGLYDVQDHEQPDMNLRGRLTTDTKGHYSFRSIRPASYPIPTDGPVGGMLSALNWHPNRPAHIHFIVSAKGFKTVTTQLFIEGDPFLESDAVFAVKDSLVTKIINQETGSGADIDAQTDLQNPGEIYYDFHLECSERPV